MFIGEYHHTVDEKGRVAIPYRFRKELQGGGIVARDLTDKCLSIYSKAEWQKLAEKITALPVSDPKAKAFARLIFSGAMEVGFDRQGRILLPLILRHYAQLKNQAVVAGVYTRIELWNEANWQAYKIKSEKSETEINRHLEEMGV